MKHLVMSSANAEKISLTIKGAVPFVLGILANKGLDIPEESIYMILDQIVVLVSGLVMVAGAARKIFNWTKKLVDSVKK